MTWDASLEPFWTSSTMKDEALFFVGDENGAGASLLFPPAEIVSMTSATCETRYEEGRDFAVDYATGAVTRPVGSRIPMTTRDELYPLRTGPRPSPMHRRGDSESGLMFAEGDAFHRRQATVTYSHRAGMWHGPIPASADHLLPRTFARLQASKPLTICLMGDSIAEGYNASAFTGIAPFQPAFGPLVASALGRTAGCPIAFHNFAVAGSTADNGMWETDPVGSVQPDLVIVAYGMNDAGYSDAANFSASIAEILNRIRREAPSTEFVLVAPMLPHPEWDYPLPQRIFEYRDALADLCGNGVASADVTGMWSALLTRKSHYDLTGNGINHPNDFGHRVYAQTILALLESPR